MDPVARDNRVEPLLGARGEPQDDPVPVASRGLDAVIEAHGDSARDGGVEQVLLQVGAEKDAAAVERHGEGRQIRERPHALRRDLDRETLRRAELRLERVEQVEGVEHPLAVAVKEHPAADPPEVAGLLVERRVEAQLPRGERGDEAGGSGADDSDAQRGTGVVVH